MSREIIFRGRRTTNGRWITGGLFEFTSYRNDMLKTHKIIGDLDDYHKVDPETVGQSTGVDSIIEGLPGSRIFEGDVVKIYNEHFGCPIPDGFTGEVRFMEGSWLVDNKKAAHLLWDEMYSWEIVGNIHDNPELIKIS